MSRDPTEDEVETCVRVLETLAEDPARLAGLDAEARRRLLTVAGRLARPTKAERKRLAKAFRKRDREARRAHDAELVARTGNRGRKLPRFVLPASTADPAHAPPLPEAERPPERLLVPRDCYVCKQPFVEVHHFYDAMCPPCAELNWRKRHQTAPLDGRVAVVTGGRIKIGYQTALLLLRAGAEVVVTTRFPADAARRFAREPDYERFRERLHVHGLDLRHVPSVELFAEHLRRTLGRLDVLVHNAAQTVRRPPAFYRHLVDAEAQPLPEAARPLLRAHEALVAALGDGGAAGGVALERPSAALRGVVASAALSQLALVPEDLRDAPLFPPGQYDLDAQQVDLREHNSWRMQLADVPTAELLEVHLVNAIAPFILTARLRPLLERDRTDEKHIINVSAMEAQFARRKKTDRHPHTNMAKAALNMMTRTSAADYAASGIFMNSVDTGWVTDEDPLHHVARKQRVHDFHPPLDAIDGAARVLDPLFTGLLTGRHPYGLFFKDYRPVDW